MISKDDPLYTVLAGIESYKLHADTDLLAIPPPPMLIDCVLPQGGIMGITSYPGVGKSWLAMELCRSIATGTKFLGHYKSVGGSALFVGSDSSLYDYARQWQRLGQPQRADYAEATRNQSREELESLYGPDWHLGIFNSIRFLIQSPFMLDDETECMRLIKTCLEFRHGPPEATYENDYDIATKEKTQTLLDIDRRHGFDLIVLDTLSRLTRANQNDNTEMENVFRNIRSIAHNTGAAVVLLHHNGKKSEFNSGEDWRGAMSQIGALDSWVQLSNSKNNKYRVRVEYKKFRGITPDDFVYDMNVSKPETATLIHANDDGALGTDEIAQSIHIFFTRPDNAGKMFSMGEVAEALYPAVADTFKGDAEQYGKAVKNRLEDTSYGLVTQRDNSPLVKTKKPGTKRNVVFMLNANKENTSNEA